MFVDCNKDDLMLKYLIVRREPNLSPRPLDGQQKLRVFNFRGFLVSKHFCLAVLLINQSHMSRRFSWLINVYVIYVQLPFPPPALLHLVYLHHSLCQRTARVPLGTDAQPGISKIMQRLVSYVCTQ